jgi:hypothetical protein
MLHAGFLILPKQKPAGEGNIGQDSVDASRGSSGSLRLVAQGKLAIQLLQSRKARGRRTLVYVRQTGTRDIQDRLESVLKQSSVQAITLYGSVDPRRRERWIEDHGYVDTMRRSCSTSRSTACTPFGKI